MKSLIGIAFLLLSVLSHSVFADDNKIALRIPKEVLDDIGYSQAIKDLESALKSCGFGIITFGLSENLQEGDRIIINSVTDSLGESYSIKPVNIPKGRTLMVSGGKRGLMYGIYKLAEEIRIGKDLWDISLDMSPAFSRRIYAEEGQLLDLPSVGYHLFKPPWVNNERFEKEKEELKKLINEIARMGFNTFCLLHVNFEDYINYKYLDKEIYGQKDVHRLKSELFAKHLNDIIDYTHDRHIEVFLQVYEFQYPPRLEELYEIDLESADLEEIISAKIRELFEEVNLDGLIVTATESLPRSGYKSTEPWRKYGKDGAGKMMAMYHNAAKKMGKTVIFRSWMVAYGAEDSGKVLESTPDDAEFEIKHTGDDFWLCHPLTDAITSGLGFKRPSTITFDVFPQYYGWSRLICYQNRISEEAKIAKQNGVTGIQAWGAWAPGCIWNDGHPGYNPDGQLQDADKILYDMAGPWNNFRIFTRGFTPGQMNAYQVGRIAWNVGLDAGDIARDWGAIHFGAGNASHIAEVLMNSQAAFRELYPAGDWAHHVQPVHFMWATTSMLDNTWIEQVHKNISLSDILQSNQTAYSRLNKMKNAIFLIDPKEVPVKKVYDKFIEGYKKTELFISLYLEYRELWIRKREMKSNHHIAHVKEMLELDFCKNRLDNILKQWLEYPEECRYWGISKEIFKGGKDYTLSPRQVLKEFKNQE